MTVELLSKKIGFVADHAGYSLKEKLMSKATQLGFECVDLGPETPPPEGLDYPDQAAKLARALKDQRVSRGVAICGSGIGISIALNRYSHIRAALAWDELTAKLSRLHNDANVVCFGARLLNADRAADFLEIWLKTEFEGGRHERRVSMINSSFQENGS